LIPGAEEIGSEMQSPEWWNAYYLLTSCIEVIGELFERRPSIPVQQRDPFYDLVHPGIALRDIFAYSIYPNSRSSIFASFRYKEYCRILVTTFVDHMAIPAWR
jgi:hypothetical protein